MPAATISSSHTGINLPTPMAECRCRPLKRSSKQRPFRCFALPTNSGWGYPISNKPVYHGGMDICAILIDADVALHFPPIDQIDSLGIAGTSSCIVVVAPISLRELEHQKIFNRSASLRERAGKLIDFLVRKMAEPDPIPLRPNVELRLLIMRDVAMHRTQGCCSPKQVFSAA